MDAPAVLRVTPPMRRLNRTGPSELFFSLTATTRNWPETVLRMPEPLCTNVRVWVAETAASFCVMRRTVISSWFRGTSTLPSSRPAAAVAPVRGQPKWSGGGFRAADPCSCLASLLFKPRADGLQSPVRPDLCRAGGDPQNLADLQKAQTEKVVQHQDLLSGAGELGKHLMEGRVISQLLHLRRHRDLR